MTNADIARVFTHIGIALELDGANPFRIRAYQEAARVIESHPESMASLAADPARLLAIRGIGKDMAQKIRDDSLFTPDRNDDRYRRLLHVRVARFAC